MQIAVMHAYIDQENYSNLSIDAALRELLKGFRLPGACNGSKTRCCIPSIEGVQLQSK